MTSQRYTPRLRYAGGRAGPGLVVEDRCGVAYIYTRKGLRCRLIGRWSLSALAPTLHRLGWVPVPPVAPYSLEELRRLLGPSA